MARNRPALVIGSRGSDLALWQARHISSELARAGVETAIHIIKTTGDHLQTASLAQAGGKGLFTKEIEDALLAGSIDLAVHSLKDLPTQMPPGLAIAAIPEREDPRDALIGSKLGDLPYRSRVGTSSGRRAAQLRVLRPDLDIQPIRGNVDTRLRKLRDGWYDAILLAVAGLRRLGLTDEIAEIFDPDRMCCAPGQGALGIETKEKGDALEICRGLNDPLTHAAVTAERVVLSELGGGCQLPLGAFASPSGGHLHLTAVAAAPDGSKHLRAVSAGPVACPEQLGLSVARDLLARGAAAILQFNAL